MFCNLDARDASSSLQCAHPSKANATIKFENALTIAQISRNIMVFGLSHFPFQYRSIQYDIKFNRILMTTT
jgi:hypothetical protein